MKVKIKNLISFILPFTVLILVPLWIEQNRSVKHVATFWAGIAMMSMGLYVMVQTISMFIKIGRGALAPWSPARRLVTGALYAYVRNPMVIEVCTILIGESIAIESWKIFVWSLAFAGINTIYFIVYEELDLIKRFGREYIDYKNHIPGWLPRLTPYQPRVIGSFYILS